MNSKKKYDYGKCLVCGEQMKEKRINQDFWLSALIVSKEGFWSWQNRIPDSLGESFILVHNPLARNRLPKKWLKTGQEIWIERGQLHKRIWKNGNEHSQESFPLPHDLPTEIRAKL